MSKEQKKYDSDIPEGSPSQDRSDRYRDDQFLRAHGFRIHSRPTTGPATWEREGRQYTSADALVIAKREQDAALARLADKTTHHAKD